jgi:hypothetical protein
MLRSAVLVPSLFLFSSSAFGQATPTESPTLQAVLTEIRQLRQDLQTSAIAARRAQILSTAYTHKRPPLPMPRSAWMKRNRQSSSCGLEGNTMNCRLNRMKARIGLCRDLLPSCPSYGQNPAQSSL